MSIGEFIINKNIIDSVNKHFSIFNNKIYIFICNNGFCITQNIAETINLNIFIPNHLFTNFDINVNHIIFNMDIKNLKFLENFILINDPSDKNIFLLLYNNNKYKINVINDITMYNFCENINRLKHHSMLINKNHFEVLLKNNKEFIKKFCDITSYDYNTVKISFYKDIHGFTLNFNDENINLDYVFNICV